MTAPPETRAGHSERTAAFSWRFVTPLFMGSAFNPTNSTMIATALVPIAHTMGVSVGRTAVLVSALYLACSVAQPTFGKLSEELGPRRVFLDGMLVIVAGGIVGGVAPDLAALIVSRAGACGADHDRHRPAGRGVLVGWLGWRSTFFANVPFALLGLVMTLAWVPRDPPRVAAAGREGQRRLYVGQVESETGVQSAVACVGELDGSLSLAAGDPSGLDERGQEVGAEASGEMVALL